MSIRSFAFPASSQDSRPLHRISNIVRNGRLSLASLSSLRVSHDCKQFTVLEIHFAEQKCSEEYCRRQKVEIWCCWEYLEATVLEANWPFWMIVNVLLIYIDWVVQRLHLNGQFRRDTVPNVFTIFKFNNWRGNSKDLAVPQKAPEGPYSRAVSVISAFYVASFSRNALQNKKYVQVEPDEMKSLNASLPTFYHRRRMWLASIYLQNRSTIAINAQTKGTRHRYLRTSTKFDQYFSKQINRSWTDRKLWFVASHGCLTFPISSSHRSTQIFFNSLLIRLSIYRWAPRDPFWFSSAKSIQIEITKRNSVPVRPSAFHTTKRKW